MPFRAAKVRISGIGVEIPEQIVTTSEIEARAELQERFGLERGWLEQMTGVKERRWAGPDVLPSDLAATAGERAVADAGLEPEELDAVIFGSISRDSLEPAVANKVASTIGAKNARVFDVNNACNGLVDAVDLAESMICCGKAQRVLVVAGERGSWVVSSEAGSVDELLLLVPGLGFGDGGGAFVIEASDDAERGISSSVYCSFPSHWNLSTGVRFVFESRHNAHSNGVVDPRFLCQGTKQFQASFRHVPPTVNRVLRRTGWRADDIDVVFTHEASTRFVSAGFGALAHSRDPELADLASLRTKIHSTAERFGNSLTFSIPLGMFKAREEGLLVEGSRVLIIAAASGASVAGLTLVW